ncbi:MAG: pilus assembly protein PilM [Phycisphaerae bacterium]|nr:pilus assembly protein PilM [Phycisphaerae bacterium]
MKVNSKTAFGIDVRSDAVSFVQLEKNGRQIKFVRASTVPLPEGTISDGMVNNPAALAGVLKSFRLAGLMRSADAGLTICAEPVLLQILNLPESTPDEVKKIIQDEVRQYAVLPLKNIEMDYCSLKTADNHSKRVLVGASQTEHFNFTVKAIEKYHIDIRLIEPTTTAFIRACFNKVIKLAGEKNIMLLLIRDETLTLCIFERQRLEFLRTKKIDMNTVNSISKTNWLAREIESVIQFYEVENDSMARPWQVIVAACSDAESDIAEKIRKDISRQNIEILPFNNNMMGIEIDEQCQTPICPVAAGAAMKLLGEDPGGISLNLLPKEIVSIRKARSEMLVIANVLACLFIVFFGYITFLGKKSINVSHAVYAQKNKQSGTDIQQMVKSRKNLNGKLSNMENCISAVNRLNEGKSYQNWAGLLAGLVNTVPQTVLIENLEEKGGNIMEIDGVAVNYDSISSFVNLLTQKGLVESASLKNSSRSTKYSNGMIDYKIVCYLKQ